MDNVTIFTIVGAVGTTCSIIFGYIGYLKGTKKDIRSDGETDGALKADIQYMKRLLEDVSLEQRRINETLSTISERVTRVEESTKQAHKRLDAFERLKSDEHA